MKWLLLFLLCSCSIQEGGTELEKKQDINRAFISLLAGNYTRLGTPLGINPHEGGFTYAPNGENFTYIFIKAVSHNTAVYRMGTKYYSFSIEGKRLYRSQDGYGSVESLVHGDYILYASAEPMDDKPDTPPSPGVDDSSPETGGGGFPSSPFLAKVANRQYVRSEFYFWVDAQGHFSFQGEKGRMDYRFQYALNDNYAIYKEGTWYYGAAMRGGYLQLTPPATKPEQVAFHLLENYAFPEIFDAEGAFKLALTRPSAYYTQSLGGAVSAVQEGVWRIADPARGKFYDFVYALNGSCAVYKNSGSEIYYGVTIENDILYFTQNGVGSSRAKDVQFHSRLIFARRNP